MSDDTVMVTLPIFGKPMRFSASREHAEQIRAALKAGAEQKRAAARDANQGVRRALRNRDSAKEAIEGICRYSSLHDSGTRLGWLLPLLARAPSYVFWPAFLSTWPGCDNIWEYTARLTDMLLRQPEPAAIYYDEQQRAARRQLPDLVTVYRGSSRERAAGISWTARRNVAEGFARGHRGLAVSDPVIATAQVRKRDILALIIARDESEVLIDPRRVKIKLHRFPDRASP